MTLLGVIAILHIQDMPGHTSGVISPHQNKQQRSNKHILGNEWFLS
jgi:hypothetical protein